MYERFNERARRVMSLADAAAHKFNNDAVGTDHVLIGLIEEGYGVGANVLKNLLNVDALRLEAEKYLRDRPVGVTRGKIPATPRLKKVVIAAIDESRALNHNHVGTEHLLLAVVRDEQDAAARALAACGVRPEAVRSATYELLTGSRTARGSPAAVDASPTRDTALDQHQLLEEYRRMRDRLLRRRDEAVEARQYELALVHRDAVESLDAAIRRIEKLLRPPPQTPQ